jgi:TetR/AcrR family transcriptional regulator, transcriptional repressor for nem operon
MSETRETILSAARLRAQIHGYTGLNFRDLAEDVGIKSASMHYHFPTKADLGVAVARRYREDSAAGLEKIWAKSPDAAACLKRYPGVFRKALEDGNRMCMCGQMAAEYDDIPHAVKVEVKGFADDHVNWLAKVLVAAKPHADNAAIRRRARAIYAAVTGAQLLARSRADLKVFDETIESYHDAGLFIL